MSYKKKLMINDDEFIKFFDLLIFLPKKDFTSSNLDELIDILRKEGIHYQIVSEDYIATSISGKIYQAQKLENAIINNYYSKVLFIPGGPGTIKLMDKVLVLAFLNKYNLEDNYIALEGEAISLFAYLNKINGKMIAKIGLDLLIYKEKEIVGVDKELVEDDNLITTNSYHNKEFIKKIIEKIKN